MQFLIEASEKLEIVGPKFELNTKSKISHSLGQHLAYPANTFVSYLKYKGMEQEQNSVALTKNQTTSDLVQANLTVDVEKVIVQFEEANLELPHHEKIQINNENWQLVLSSSNKDEFFEKLKIDWILKAFSQPVIVLNETVFKKAIQKDITNPLRLTRYILEREGVAELISPKYFYKRVFCNPHIDTLVKFNAIIRMLKAVKSPAKFIDDFLEPMYRYLYDEKYTIEVDKFIKAGRQLDISWSRERLIREYLDLTVEYKGTLTLPESCTLITHRRELKNEGLKMRHCIVDY